MLTRRAHYYSSYCSLVVLFYLQLFRRNSLLNCSPQLKSAKYHHLRISGLVKASTLCTVVTLNSQQVLNVSVRKFVWGPASRLKPWLHAGFSRPWCCPSFSDEEIGRHVGRFPQTKFWWASFGWQAKYLVRENQKKMSVHVPSDFLRRGF